MPRPHIEFIQSQVLPWKELGEGASRPGAAVKSLSFDPTTKATTVMMRYPKGWRLSAAHYLDSDEELFVIEGALWVNDTEYVKGDYAYLPAGLPRAHMHSETGAVVLTFHEGSHCTVYGAAPPGLYDEERCVAKVESEKMPWGSTGDPVVTATANDAGLKVLRIDPVTRERTWLLRFGADDPATTTHGRVERHPVVEEFFLLDGEVSMNGCGTQKPGAYFWRPPNMAHGPVSTSKGLFGIFRSKGGPLTTQWSDEALPIDWHPSYTPILPPEMAALSTSHYDSALRY